MRINTELETISTAQTLDDWKLAMIRMVVVYRIKAKGDKLPIDVQQTDFEFVESVLDDMYQKDLLAQSEDQTHWILTEKGETVFNSLRELDDHASQFGIFGEVHIGQDVSDLLDEDEEIPDGIDDPRFEIIEDQTDESMELLQTEDLRIALILFLNEYAVELGDSDTPKVNPYQVVFARMLQEGKISGDDIWFNLRLGTFFNEVQEIVDSMYNWKSVTTNIHTQECEFEEGKVQISAVEGESVTIGQALFTDMEGTVIKSEVNGQITEVAIDSDDEGDEEGEFLVFTIEMTPESHVDACKVVMSNIFKAGMLQLQKEELQKEEDEDDSDEGDDEDEIIVETTTTTIIEEDIIEDDIWGCGGVYIDPYDPYGYYDPYSPLADAIVFGACVGVLACCW